MLLLILGLVLFLGTHALSMVRDVRSGLIKRLGEGGYKGAYTAASLIGFGLIIYGFGAYRASGWIQIWSPPVWTKHLALLLTGGAKLEFVGLLTFHISTLASRLPDHQDRKALPSALLTPP